MTKAVAEGGLRHLFRFAHRATCDIDFCLDAFDSSLIMLCVFKRNLNLALNCFAFKMCLFKTSAALISTNRPYLSVGSNQKKSQHRHHHVRQLQFSSAAESERTDTST